MTAMWKAVIVSAFVVCAGGCRDAQVSKQSSRGGGESEIAFLTREGCVNTAVMRANLDHALRAIGRTIDYAVIDLDTVSADDARVAYGTPTVLYRGRDLFGMPAPTTANPEAT